MPGPNLAKSKKQITAELKMLNSMYKELEDDLKALHEKAAAYQNDSRSDAKVKALRDEQDRITRKYASQLLPQLEDFFRGPGKDDPETISEWIGRNYLAVRLFMSEDYTYLNMAGAGKYEYLMPNAGAISRIFTSVFDPNGIYPGSDKPVKNPVGAYEMYMKPHVETALNKYDERKGMIDELRRDILKTAPEIRELTPYEKDRNALGLLAVNLECAATFTNSDEYKNIIKSVKALNKTDSLPGGPNDLTDKRKYAAKLIDIKKKISSYIEHKAMDGVKKNVYDKLAAVEKLNKFISGKIKELVPAYGYDDPDQKISNRYTQKDVSEKLKNRHQAERCANALDFMGRIINKAEQKRVSPKQLMDLQNMQAEFFENPGPREPEAAVKTASSPLAKNAAEAIKTGMKMGHLKSSTQKLFQAAEKDDSFTFETSMELACCYAQMHKLKVEINFEGNDEVFPVEEVISKTETVAKKAASFAGKNEAEADFWRNLVNDNLQRIQSRVRDDLYNRAETELTNFNKSFTDEELINEWPLLSFKASCYREMTYHNDETVRQILEKSEELSTRMENLSRGTVRNAEKKAEEKTQDMGLVH